MSDRRSRRIQGQSTAEFEVRDVSEGHRVDGLVDAPVASAFDRRRFLGAAVYVTGALGAAALVGCSGDDDADGATATAISTAPATSAPASPTPAAAKRGGTLKMGQGTDLTLNLGYPFALLAANRIVSYAAHETLIRYEGNQTPVPVLASKWDVAADFTKVTATLKSGVLFHNNQPLTTDDVVFSLQAIQDPAAAGITAALDLTAFAKTITATVTGPQTIEFTLDKARPNVNDFFAQMHIAQRSTFPEIAKSSTVFGTGPFQLKERTAQGYRLERFAAWHGAGATGAPYLDAIEVTLYPANQATVVPNLRTNLLDAYFAVQAPIALPLQGTPQVHLAGKTGMNYLGLNLDNPQFRDPRVRQAIYFALDRALMVKSAGQGFGDVTSQPWNPGSPAFEAARDAAPYGYDPAKAKGLLQTAGFTQTQPLVIEYAMGSALQENTAILAQQNLDAVGFKVNLLATDPTAYQQRVRTRLIPDFWLASHGAGDLTPLSLFGLTQEFRPSGNLSNFSDANYTSRVASLDGLAPDSAQAKAAYKDINQILQDSAFIIPTGIPAVRIDVVAEKVGGWPTNPSEYFIAPPGKVDFSKVWLR